MNNLNKIANNGRLVAMLSVLAIVALGLYFSLAFQGIDLKTLLDTTFNFSPAQVHSVLDGYGATLRNRYLGAELIDFGTMIFVSWVQAVVVMRAFSPMRWGRKLFLVPLVAMALNSLKDIALVTVLLQFPNESTALASLANIINMAKTIFVDASLGLVLIAALVLFARGIRKMMSKTTS